MSAPRLSAGGVIAGKYSVRQILGDAGSVITYQAVSQQGQEVAIKVYDPAVAAHPTVMKALEQAYAATNALPPSSAAAIIDAGYDQPTAAPFSVTELIQLPSLTSQQRRLSPEEAVGMLKGLARSVDLAHLRQVVHGALKPSNVFVGPNSNPVIVTDFAASLPKAALPTQEGFAGSAPWIAPEQAQSGNVTAGADVFSAALVVFFALTGRSYWRACQNGIDVNAWQQELSGARSPASMRATEIGVPLSPNLDPILWKALSLEPNDRYRSLGEFATALEEGLRKQIGNQATMALPLVHEAPSPLPAHMQAPKPSSAPMGLAGAATMAFPMPMSEIAMAQAQMNMSGGHAQMNMSGGHAQMNMSGGHAQMNMSGGHAQAQMNMSGGHAQMNMSGGHMQHQEPQMGYGPPPQYGYGGQAAQSSPGYGAAPYGMDGGYPPPPVGLQSPAPAAAMAARSKNKVVPLVIGFTAVALLGGVGAVWAVKYRNAPPEVASTGPVSVPTTNTPTATAPPIETPSPSVTASAAAAPETVDLRVTCTPKCETVKVDGANAEIVDIMKLAPGKHKVEVAAAGYKAQTFDVDLALGKPLEKTITLVSDAPVVVTQPQVTTVKNPVTPSTGKPVVKPVGDGKKCGTSFVKKKC